MLCFSWSIAISTCNPLSHAIRLFYIRTSSLSGTHRQSQSDDGGMRWRFAVFLQTKAPNCDDMAPLDLRHYWGQSWEEPCNLQDLLVHRFFPYLPQWRYAATQSLPGVTVAFSGELNRALCHKHWCILIGPCARKHTHSYNSLHAQLCSHTHTHTHTHTPLMPPVVPSSHGTQQVWGGLGGGGGVVGLQS